MESVMHAMCRATITLPRQVIAWMVETAGPKRQPWRDLVQRDDLTDQQAWECLWRDDALIKSAMKIPGKWTANAASDELADVVALYLARSDVPAGRIALLRTRLDSDQLRRIDLLRCVTRLGGSDLVCQEIVAEPPPGSSREEHLGPRELALIERYRQAARDEAADRNSTANWVVDQILQKEGVIARAATARQSDPVDPLKTLKACLFGRGSVAARPEDADFATAQYLLTLGRHASTYYYADEGLGEVLSALRPILRAYINPGYTPPRSWVSERLLTFGEAGVVPLNHSIYAEEGDYLVRRFGSNVSKYESLGKLVGENQDVPLRVLCDRVEAEQLARHRWIVEQQERGDHRE
ncbi:hypothetical protein [Nocardia sp. 348MFTsu5.1]|uniref:hypothetical protein n=1 Tax=Nocardia sp. 348MFTsu5.1 TaxID=1172185 RepID=UPI00037FB693|nr:hypothetical protein [Nocardia sp. 348MFTsu5.1]